MLSALTLALVLSRPTDVLEQWELLPDAPLRELVTARASYDAGDGVALLPACVQGAEMPSVQAFGDGPLLRVVRRPEGWAAVLPLGRAHVRLAATLLRPTPAPRLFRLRWPASLPGRERRVVTLPRDWLTQEPAGWTCPEPLDRATMSCVSTALHPRGFALSIPSRATSRATGALALAVIVAAGVWVERSKRSTVARACAVVGAVIAQSLALVLVGARIASWGQCAIGLVPLGMAVGVQAARHPLARWAGLVGALTIPLASTTWGAAGPMAAMVLACAAAVLGFALVGESDRAGQ